MKLDSAPKVRATILFAMLAASGLMLAIDPQSVEAQAPPAAAPVNAEVVRSQPVQETLQRTTPFSGGRLKGCPAGGGGDFEVCRTVNLATGEFQGRIVVFQVPSDRGVPFTLIATYRSQVQHDGPLGHQWDHNYNRHLAVQANGDVLRYEGHGRVDRYVRNPLTGTFASPAGFYDVLAASSPGWTITDAYGTKETYSQAGRLQQIQDRNGNTQSLSYDPQGRLQAVRDAHGRDTTFTYYSHNRVHQVTDPMGHVTSFSYDSSGNLVGITTPATAAYPAGKTTQFSYAPGSHALLTARDPAGNFYLTNAYDSDLRVTSQTFGPCGSWNFAYNPALGITTTTDPNGNLEAWTFKSAAEPVPITKTTFTNRDIRPTDPAAYTQLFTHNPNFELTSQAEPGGNHREWVYDDSNPDPRKRGNILTFAHYPAPSGGTVEPVVRTRTYDPLFNQIKTSTEPRGNSLLHVPQNGGATSAGRYTTTYYYDHEEATLGDLNGDGITTQSKGNVVRIQRPNAHAAGAPDARLSQQAANQAVIETFQYNAHGQVTRYMDPTGKVQQYTYLQGNGIPGDASDREGFLQSRTLDPTAQALTWSYAYDPNGNVLSATDPRGNTASYQLNERGQVTKYTPPGGYGYEVLYAYDANDNVRQRTTRNVVQDESGNHQVVGAHPQFVDTFEYNAYDLPTAETRDAWRSPTTGGSTLTISRTEWLYDCNLNCIATLTPAAVLLGASTNIETNLFDERNLVAAITRGGATPQFKQLTANAAGAQLPTSATQSTASMSYDGNGNMVSHTDPNGLVTLFAYDGFNRPIVEIDPAGNREEASYDIKGSIISRRSYGAPAGQAPLVPGFGGAPVLLAETHFKFDELGRQYEASKRFFDPVLGIQYDDGLSTSLKEFDAAGRLVATFPDSGASSTYAYDGAGRRVASQDAMGNSATHAYDGAGNLVRVVRTELDTGGGPPQTYTTWNTYDALNRLTRSTDSMGHTVRHGYDSHNNRVWSSDPQGPLGVDPLGLFPGPINQNGNTWRATYDGLGRLWEASATLRDNGAGNGLEVGRVQVRQEWDPNGRLVRAVDANGNAMAMTFDDHDRLASITYADNTQQSFAYDLAGRMTQHTDQRGTVERNTYDVLGRLVLSASTPSDGVQGTSVQRFEYDGRDRLTLAFDGNDPSTPLDDSLLVRRYDSLGNLRSERQGQHEVAATYDAGGNRLTLAYPGTRAVSFDTDLLGRVEAVASDGETLLESTYIGGRLRSQELDNGLTAGIDHDAAGRLVGLEYQGLPMPFGTQRSVGRAGQVLATHWLHEPDQDILTDYDSAYRPNLVERGTLDANWGTVIAPSTDLPSTQSWSYDPAGNWINHASTLNGQQTSEARTHSDTNGIDSRTVNGNTVTLADDAAGNLVSDGARSYTWDAKGRLAAVHTGGELTASYRYDALGRLVGRTGANGATQTYVYDGSRVIQEHHGDALAREFVYTAQGDPLLIDRNLDQDGRADGPGDERLFVLLDDRDSPIALADDAGGLVEGYHYDTFGRPWQVLPGSNQALDFGGDDIYLPGPSGRSPFGYDSLWLDPETGLGYRVKDGFYSPELGRALSRPGLGLPAFNDPAVNFNPSTLLDRFPDPDRQTVTGATCCSGYHEGGCTGEGCSGPDANGMMVCNYNSGCSRECTQRHEEVHQADRGACCNNFQDCMKNASTKAEEDACKCAYTKFQTSGKSITECRAYMESEACMKQNEDYICCEKREKNPDDCCENELPEGEATCECWRNYRDSTNAKQLEYCGTKDPTSAPTMPGCTIDSSGNPTASCGGGGGPPPPPRDPWYCQLKDKVPTFTFGMTPMVIKPRFTLAPVTPASYQSAHWETPFPSLTFGRQGTFVENHPDV